MDRLLFDKTAERHGWPTCGKCNKPVDELIQVNRTSFNASMKIMAHCHGEYETIEIPDSILADMRRPEDVRLDGVAFAPKLLLSA